MSGDTPVGIIGLGLMGTALAERLTGAGIAVIGFDIDANRRDVFRDDSRKIAASGSDLAGQSQSIVIAVYDGAQVEALLGEFELSPARPALICTTTCAPDEIERIAARAANAGFTFVEAPISGTSAEVKDGAATALVAGDADAIEALDALLAVLCPHRIRIGNIGDASRTKLAINLILQNNRAALAEGIVFAERLGLDGQAFLAAARQSAAYSRVMDTKGEKMVSRDFRPQSHIAQTLKDAELILHEARRRGLRLAVTEARADLLRAAIALDGAERDSSAIIEAIRQRPSSEVVR
ncbi:NAD(P)-dependent oxidoreductase [Bradyrhizobium sp. KBS0727]|uniref:NAD(P)-dependent oxidoreductase n=1 Tax=unclassified Bradyrhizobium TaxID=2631580 RepID=UPI00110F61C4|nr:MULTISPECIES: NAD(P)-dependent oxidoreductase [unclassified Bradyrhizobium]QDW40087.1 NAD(P)-dependent oxidoreductase [Bradyrhizobium sp. KBS0725]QDW46690.1 NAD(P)-dependent oxidoreductase [Bradyrhizobium sp. KBS0727]